VLLPVLQKEFKKKECSIQQTHHPRSKKNQNWNALGKIDLNRYFKKNNNIPELLNLHHKSHLLIYYHFKLIFLIIY
jgi:hypothetical protein